MDKSELDGNLAIWRRANAVCNMTLQDIPQNAQETFLKTVAGLKSDAVNIAQAFDTARSVGAVQFKPEAAAPTIYSLIAQYHMNSNNHN